MRLSQVEQKLALNLNNLSIFQKFVAIIYFFAFIPPVVILATKLTESFGFTAVLHARSNGLNFFLASLIALLIMLSIIIVMVWTLLMIMPISEVQGVSQPETVQTIAPVSQLPLNGVSQRPLTVWTFRPSAARSMNNTSLAAFAVPITQFPASKFVRNRQSQLVYSADLL